MGEGGLEGKRGSVFVYSSLPLSLPRNSTSSCIQELEDISRKLQEEKDNMQSKRKKKEEGEVQALLDQAAEKEHRQSSECESLRRRLKKAEDSTDKAPNY